MSVNVKPYQQSWHYPRTQLAETFLETLRHSAPTMAIFAERRKGKTEFLNEDIAPLAKAAGHRVCYINFWADRSNPIACVLAGVESTMKSELGRALRGWKKEVAVNLGVLRTKITKEPGIDVQTAHAALQVLLEPKGSVLLLCDEVQHLATRPEFEDFTASLRTFIDSNRKRVRTVFTGSSQDNLNRLFRHQKAAFYNSASIVPFPDMGIEFIEFLSKRFEYLSKRCLPVDDLMSIFADYHYSPAFIVELLQIMLREGIYDAQSGLERYHLLSPPNADNEMLWKSLTALEQVILKHLLQEEPGPIYHKDRYREFSDCIGAKVTQSAVQVALNRLRENGVLNKVEHGVWRFESTSFRFYVEEQMI